MVLNSSVMSIGLPSCVKDSQPNILLDQFKSCDSLKEDSFVEDAAGDPKNPGKSTKYGHRDTIAGNPENPDTTQDYPTSCGYWGLDQPGGKGGGATVATFAAGDRMDIDLTFQGKIIDVCNGGADVPGFVREWKWGYQKTLG